MSVERALSWLNRLIVVVVDRHPQFVLDFGRLSGDFSVDINVTIAYLQRFTRKPNQSFDVVYRGIERIFEHNHVPSFGLEELINAL